MCGICGAIDLTDMTLIQPDSIQAMTKAIAHRGPDGDGFYMAGSVGLGMRRLSIIDLEGGNQPIGNEDGAVQIVFNGEIYNYIELQQQLRQRGHQLATQSDTETIVHLYEDFGLDLFAHLRGMYAFALWDERAHRLVLAIDHIGIKPLYVCQVGTLLVFASEVKALFAFGSQIPRELDETLLDTYMSFGFMVGQETLFKGIRRLAPGSALIIENHIIRELQHWTLDYTPLEAENYIGQIRSTLEEAVRIHLRSDVPLGLFLSGGIDSATLLALMSKSVPGRIKTFTVGYVGGDYQDNELEAARQTALCFDSEHHELRLTAADWWDAVCHYVYAHDEPNANPSAVSLLALSKLTAQSVKVVLNGIGSDELFGGYPVHRNLPLALDRARQIRQIMPGPIRHGLLSVFEQAERLYPFLSRYRGLGALPNVLPPLYHQLDDDDDHIRRTMAFDGTVFSTALRRSLFAHDPGDATKRKFQALLESTPTNQRDNLIHFLKIYLWLPGNGLLSADKVSMAYSLEGRVPYFDRYLMELAARMPPQLRLKENKYLLRAATQDLLPKAIRSRLKQPFGTPIQAWFSTSLRPQLKEILYDPTALQRPYFRKSAYQRLLDNHFAGRTSRPEIIWRLVNLELWQRTFIDR
ncbi:MAG: asparagine synthase (glutamine-hydrolyzing) [Aggregatilineales bacterium]